MKLLIASVFASIIYLSMSDFKDPGSVQSDDQSQKPLFSFGIVSDVQYCNCEPAGTRFYRSSPEKLRDALNRLNSDSVSYIINLGDLIDREYGSFKTVLDIMDSSGLKIYHVAGNHDYSVDAQYKKRLPVVKPSKNGYYSFSYKNFRFIFLNGNELSTYSTSAKSAVRKADNLIRAMKEKGEINAVEWNGGFTSKQIGWLKGELDDAVTTGEKVVIICHFPVAPDNVHNLLNYKEVLPVLANYRNIIAWFNGHNHAGNYSYLNMIHFVTFKGMVETESDNSFASVTVFKNKLVIKGYGREKSQILGY
jgi:manganese-dependent ADP-ribose/CDP-alcohol diphosphatase